MKLGKSFGLLALLVAMLLLQACDFASTTGGGGTGGEGLTGIIVDSDGSPVVGAKVRIYPEDYILAKASLVSATSATIRRDSTVTDSVGRFRFTNLAKGRYNIEASALRNGAVWSVFIPGVYVGGPVDLGRDTVRTSGSIAFSVADENHAPLFGASCYIVGGPWEDSSDLSGLCALTGLAPGTFRVLVTYPGRKSVLFEGVTVAPGQQVFLGGAVLMPSDSGTDTTWTERYPAANENLKALAWSGSLAVAVGSGTDVFGDVKALILTSPDGLTWTKQDVGNAKPLDKVIWAGNQFVALGDHGHLLTSPNGIAWTARRLPDTTWPLTTMIWSGTRILVTSWNAALVSTDGVTWVDSSLSTIFYGVAHSGTLFVGVGPSGVVKTSTNGLTWTPRDAQTTSGLSAVAWNGSQFAAVGDNGTIRTSADGITWEKRVSGTLNSFTSVVWLKDRWIANNTIANNLQSTDGVTWTTYTPSLYLNYGSVVSIGPRLIGIAGGIYTSP